MKCPLFAIVHSIALFLLTGSVRAEAIAEQWVHRYNGPANMSDSATAVAVDAAGNVIVTGGSVGATVSEGDFYTAKYAGTDGSLLWEHRYSSTGGSDGPKAVIIDGQGNAIVTGYADNAAGFGDFYTAKYAAADGALIWERRYSGPGNGYDFAEAVAVDSAGNVIVAGSSDGGPGSNYDLCTVKYAAADGALLWEKRYDGPRHSADGAWAVAVDAGGNAIVTGYAISAAGDADSYTAKYAGADGALLWERSYDGPAHSHDATEAVAIDALGNVLVTGMSTGSATGEDFYTAKYAAVDGALLWERHLNGAADENDHGYAVVADAGGNAIVTGVSIGDDFTEHLYAAKYAAMDGALIWEKQHGPRDEASAGSSVAVDPAGNALVAGTVYGAGSPDYYTAKFAAADGALLWEKLYNGPPNFGDYLYGFRCLALTPDGGAVVAGHSSTGISSDFATVKYVPSDTDEDGLLDSWERRHFQTIAGHGPLDDTDGDGRIELLEAAFATDPLVPDRLSAPTAVEEGGFLTITIARQPGVTYLVQTGTTPDPAAFSATTTTVLRDTAMTLKVRDNVATGTAAARFLRVKITAAP